MPWLTAPVISAAISGGAAITGDIMASQGAGVSANRNLAEYETSVNLSLEEQQKQFQQADYLQKQSQAFSGAQVAAQDTFQKGMVKQQEQFQNAQVTEAQNYATHMSDTQIQRRMADLKAAGVNPLLAVGGSVGGASSPQVSPASGSAMPGAAATLGSGSASGGTGVSPQVPPNTMASFANLGAQAAQALSLTEQQSRIRANTSSADASEAAAGKDTATTNQLIPYQAKQMMAQYSLTAAQATIANDTIRDVEYKIGAEAGTAGEERNIAFAKSRISTMDMQTMVATQNELIKSLNAQYAAAAAAGTNVQAVEASPAGKLLAFINAILTPMHTGSQINRNMQ